MVGPVNQSVSQSDQSRAKHCHRHQERVQQTCMQYIAIHCSPMLWTLNLEPPLDKLSRLVMCDLLHLQSRLFSRQLFRDVPLRTTNTNASSIKPLQFRRVHLMLLICLYVPFCCRRALVTELFDPYDSAVRGLSSDASKEHPATLWNTSRRLSTCSFEM